MEFFARDGQEQQISSEQHGMCSLRDGAHAVLVLCTQIPVNPCNHSVL